MSHNSENNNGPTLTDRKEPRLQDLLDDPLMQLLMARDGVSRDEIVELATRVRRTLVANRWQKVAA